VNTYFHKLVPLKKKKKLQVQTSMDIYTYVCKTICMYICTYAHMFIHMYVHMHEYIYICMKAHVYVFIHTGYRLHHNLIYITSKVFLLSLHLARQLYCLESLHVLGHPTTAKMLWTIA